MQLRSRCSYSYFKPRGLDCLHRSVAIVATEGIYQLSGFFSGDADRSFLATVTRQISSVARQAHNLKVAGSNPAPATTSTEQAAPASSAACLASRPSSTIRTTSPTSSASWPSPAECRTTRSIRLRSRPSASSRSAGSASASCSRSTSCDRPYPSGGGRLARGWLIRKIAAWTGL